MKYSKLRRMTTTVETAIKSPECRQFRRTIWLSVTRINAHVHRNIVTRQDTFVVAAEGNRQESLEFPIYNVNHDSAIISKLQNNNHKSGEKISKQQIHTTSHYRNCIGGCWDCPVKRWPNVVNDAAGYYELVLEVRIVTSRRTRDIPVIIIPIGSESFSE